MSSTITQAALTTVSADRPMPPLTINDSGLVPESIDDLLLKTLYVQGAKTGRELTDNIALPFEIVDERLLALQEQRKIEVVATVGPNRGSYRFNLTDVGRKTGADALAACAYVGPAPVPLKDYEKWILRQGLGNIRLTRDMIRQGFGDLVLSEDTFDTLGPAVNSARSVFLHGEAGNGKTLTAETIAHLIGGSIFIPFAVDISGQIMVLFDPSHHEPVDEMPQDGATWLRANPDYDLRYVRIRRPVVMAGGELTLDQLDLQFDHHTKMYQAPFQLKAAGGVLIIDDFGRQRVPAHELLNRWIVPLEKKFDFLSLHTGVKFRVPFESLLIFATNLEPQDLVDEAFLRRIQYKLYMAGPDRVAYTEIFRRVCAKHQVPFNASAVDWVFRQYYDPTSIVPRACHPRDIVEHVMDVAKYEGVAPELSPEFLRRACEAYFLVMESAAMSSRPHRAVMATTSHKEAE
jgi:predicted ATPase with chaperone activity